MPTRCSRSDQARTRIIATGQSALDQHAKDLETWVSLTGPGSRQAGVRASVATAVAIEADVGRRETTTERIASTTWKRWRAVADAVLRT